MGWGGRWVWGREMGFGMVIGWGEKDGFGEGEGLEKVDWLGISEMGLGMEMGFRGG